MSGDEDYYSDDEQNKNLSKKELQELKRKQQKNKKKKESKKRAKATKQTESEVPKPEETKKEETDEDLGVEIEYVGETIEIGPDNPNAQYFAAVFDAFKVGNDEYQYL